MNSFFHQFFSNLKYDTCKVLKIRFNVHAEQKPPVTLEIKALCMCNSFKVLFLGSHTFTSGAYRGTVLTNMIKFSHQFRNCKLILLSIVFYRAITLLDGWAEASRPRDIYGAWERRSIVSYKQTNKQLYLRRVTQQ